MNEQTTQSPPFESWAVLEIFGHQKYAGYVTQMTLGNAVMWRCDVPAVEQDGKTTQPFTKVFGVSAIFSITPCSEEIVRRLIASWQVSSKPLHVFALPESAAPANEDEAEEDLDLFDRMAD